MTLSALRDDDDRPDRRDPRTGLGAGLRLQRAGAAAAALILALTLSACSFVSSLGDQGAAAPQAADSAAGSGALPATPLHDALALLTGTELFSDHGAEHVLSGEINGKGQAVGFHSLALGELAAGRIVPGTASGTDAHGLYEAQVTVSGTGKAGNDGYSTFFPDAWTAQQVVDAIGEAYASRVSSGDGGLDGVTSGGITVHMYVDDEGLVTTAYPVMED